MGPGNCGPRTEGIVKLKHRGCGAGGSRGAGPSRCEPITEGIINLEKKGGAWQRGDRAYRVDVNQELKVL